ncbi:hypothetical protein G9A89_001469 [Geosiphon pyriformis]|nr:hypothetical protein G9A89_001469 [Geosiphon pyriformis]
MHMHIDTSVLWPLYFEKTKITSGPIHTRSHMMTSSFTIAKLMNEVSLGVQDAAKAKRMALFSSLIYIVLSTKSLDKIGSCDISLIVRLCKFIDDLCSKKDKFNTF